MLQQENGWRNSDDTGSSTSRGPGRGSRSRNRGNSDAGTHFNDSNKAQLLPLINIFNEFAKSATLATEEMEDLKKAQRLRQEEPEKESGSHRMGLPALEAWFSQAKIFSNPLCKITPSDIRMMFAKMGVPALAYKEFETFINDLCEFRKINPDVIILRLRMRASPELQNRVTQITVPEGTVDRLIDALHFTIRDIAEHFVDLSKEPYQEPICFGGIRNQARRAKSQKEEETILKAKAKSIMKNGHEASKLGLLHQKFIYYAKNGNYYSDGRSMGLLPLIKWMKQAGVIDGENITAVDIAFLFKRLYTLNWRLYVDDLHQLLNELSLWKSVPKDTLLNLLKSCDDPASSSASIISMQIPSSKYELMTKAMASCAENFEDNREKYEPSSADTPYGHTPNSRNRHFQNDIDECKMKVRSMVLDDVKTSKGGDAVGMVTRHPGGGKAGEADEKEEAFSEERRGGKDVLAKRWNDAYPIGGIDGSHRARIEADLEKIMFGPERYDDSSSEDEERVKKKIRAKYAIVAAPPVAHPAIPLEEQFEKFKSYGEHKADEGISLQNIQLWFELAGMLGTTNAIFLRKEVEEKFKNFTFSDQKNQLDFSMFMNFVDALGEAHKKQTNAKEMRDRLARCGPPRLLSTQLTSIPPLEPQDAGGAPQQKQKDEDDDADIDPAFKARFLEFARFGEATVETSTPSSPGISMLNADKWFRQAKLTEKGLNPGDVDVLYKQYFPTKQRINLREFLKLVDGLAHTSKLQGVTTEVLVAKLESAGAPNITDISQVHKASTAPTVTSRKSVPVRQEKDSKG